MWGRGTSRWLLAAAFALGLTDRAHADTTSLPAPAPVEPDARVTATRQQVEALRKGSPDWATVRRGLELVHMDRLRTGARAGAEFALKDGSRIVMSEQSLLVIHKSPAADAKKKKGRRRSGDVVLVNGVLQVTVAEQGPGVVEIVTPGAAVMARVGEAQISADPDKLTRVSALRGEVDVEAKGKLITLQAGFGTRIAKGKAAEPPTALTAAPLMVAPKPGAFVLAGAPSRLAWGPSRATPLADARNGGQGHAPGAMSYLCELSRDAAHTDEVLRAERLSTVALEVPVPALSAGRYHLRVTGRDAKGLWGIPSQQVIDVVELKIDLGRLNPMDEIEGMGHVRLSLVAPGVVPATLDGEPVSFPLEVKKIGLHQLVLGAGELTFAVRVAGPRAVLDIFEEKGAPYAELRLTDAAGEPFNADDLSLIARVGRAGVLSRHDAGLYRAKLTPAVVAGFHALEIEVRWQGQPLASDLWRRALPKAPPPMKRK